MWTAIISAVVSLVSFGVKKEGQHQQKMIAGLSQQAVDTVTADKAVAAELIARQKDYGANHTALYLAGAGIIAAIVIIIIIAKK
jgi:hypothetical protein